MPRTWNAKAAVDIYRGFVITALRRAYGAGKKYAVLEDNDPTGYKSNLAIEAKRSDAWAPQFFIENQLETPHLHDTKIEPVWFSQWVVGWV